MQMWCVRVIVTLISRYDKEIEVLCFESDDGIMCFDYFITNKVNFRN